MRSRLIALLIAPVFYESLGAKAICATPFTIHDELCSVNLEKNINELLYLELNIVPSLTK